MRRPREFDGYTTYSDLGNGYEIGSDGRMYRYDRDSHSHVPTSPIRDAVAFLRGCRERDAQRPRMESTREERDEREKFWRDAEVRRLREDEARAEAHRRREEEQREKAAREAQERAARIAAEIQRRAADAQARRARVGALTAQIECIQAERAALLDRWDKATARLSVPRHRARALDERRVVSKRDMVLLDEERRTRAEIERVAGGGQ